MVAEKQECNSYSSLTPRQSGHSNFCPCITGPLSTLWEESALIKKSLLKVRQAFTLTVRKSRSVWVRSKCASKMIVWAVSTLHEAAAQAVLYISYGCSMPVCLINRYCMFAQLYGLQQLGSRILSSLAVFVLSSLESGRWGEDCASALWLSTMLTRLRSVHMV